MGYSRKLLLIDSSWHHVALEHSQYLGERTSGKAKIVIGVVVLLVNKLKFELIAINLIVLSGLGAPVLIMHHCSNAS